MGGKPKGPVTKNTERSILSKTQATFYMIKYYDTDQYSAYIKAISDLQDEGVIPRDTEHSQIKYLNNIIESDHFRLKKAMKIIHGFKSFASAARTIKGMECMLMLKKRQVL